MQSSCFVSRLTDLLCIYVQEECVKRGSFGASGVVSHHTGSISSVQLTGTDDRLQRTTDVAVGTTDAAIGLNTIIIWSSSLLECPAVGCG
jgi:hypothetical protein